MKARIFFLMLTFCCVAAHTARSEVIVDSVAHAAKDSLFQAGLRLYSEAKYEQAVGVFSSVPTDSLTAPELFYMGLSYAALNDLNNARCCLSGAVQRDSLNVPYRYNLAQLLARQGAIDGAIAEYKQILSINSSFFPALEQLGQLCELWQKEPIEFRDSVWLRVLSLRPRDYVALYYHGLSMFRKDMQDSGFVCLIKAVEEDSLFYAAVYELAVRNLSRKNTEETFAWYTRAVRLRPSNPKLLSELGSLYQKLIKPRSALPYLLRAVEIDTANATYAEQTGLLYYYLGKFDSSAAYLKKAILLDKGNWSYYLNLALAYSQMDSSLSAVQALRVAIRTYNVGEGANLYLRLGNLLVGRKDFAEAKKEYQRALEIEPADLEPRFRLAMMYVQTNDRESARKEFQKYLQSIATDSTKSSKKEEIEKWLRYLERSKEQ